MSDRVCLAIDLKSFYASVECVERGLDPLDTCLTVADRSRTEKTICLAVSPPLKAFGCGARPRLFEVIQIINQVNRHRGRSGSSYSKAVLDADPSVAVDYIVAQPRMGLYMKYSARIYQIYLRYFAPEDIHVYSVDEVFIDATSYHAMYPMPAHDLALMVIRDILAETGITATAGIGTNLYLAKVAMDIVAKKMKPDKDGVRVASLDEMSYRRLLWTHLPLSDFWRVGRATARRLARYQILTMGDIARCSLRHEGLLYRLFGVNAELLIDHAWGWEPTTIADIKRYTPMRKSLGSGQVLHCPYTFDKARTVIMEMADSLALDLLQHRLLAEQVTITVGYDAESLRRPDIAGEYTGRTRMDHYGRLVPVHAHGTISLDGPTALDRAIISAVVTLFDRIVNPKLLIRRLNVTALRLSIDTGEMIIPEPDLFTDQEQIARRNAEKAKEMRRQEAMLRIRRRFGKNAILKGLNFAEGATQRDRNCQIGGHHE